MEAASRGKVENIGRNRVNYFQDSDKKESRVQN